MPSRYIIEEAPNSFSIRGVPHSLDRPGTPGWLVELAYDASRSRRVPVTIVQRPFYLEEEGRECAFGLFEYYALLKHVSETLMSKWLPTAQEELVAENEKTACLRSWAVKQTAWALNKRVHAQWKRLLGQVDPMVLAVNKAVFAAAFGHGPTPLLMSGEVFKEKYIVKDILSYRAAAVATRLRDRHESVGDAIERMREWRACFCPPGMRPYTALNKTLDSLPGGVPPRLLGRLDSVVLPRPLTSRLELLAALLGVGHRQHYEVMVRSNQEQVARAVEKVSAALHRPLSPRRWRDVSEAVRYMLDFPDRHNGHIVGLADKSIDWHRHRQREETNRVIAELGGDAPAATPPVPLPETPGVTFLGTVARICEEGERMTTCIASYARKAVKGRCYLFHVEQGGEEASVEVTPNGRVVQAYGPRNQRNRAAAWGKGVLNEWGRQLSHLPVPAPIDAIEDDDLFIQELRRL